MKHNNKSKGKTRNKKAKTSIWRKLLTVIGGLIVLGAAVVIITVILTAAKVGHIDQDSLYANIERSSILYDIDGTEIDTLHYTEDRKIVPVSIPTPTCFVSAQRSSAG